MRGHDGLSLIHICITARPTKGFTSPNWSGIEVHGRTYAPFELNVQRLVPFHTLTGRQHFYMDHEWMRGLGESLPVYRPPLSLAAIGEISGPRIPRTDKELVLNFLSPHSKWSIHSSYSVSYTHLDVYKRQVSYSSTVMTMVPSSIPARGPKSVF